MPASPNVAAPPVSVPNPAVPESDRIVSIQLLRALACLLVLWVHLSVFNAFTAYKLSGSIGVDIFFVLSGYIMADAVGRLPARGRARQFARNRFCRIVPYYYLLSLLNAGVRYACFGLRPSWQHVAQSFLFLPLSRRHDPLLNVGWSLNHEVFFYAFVSVALLRTRNPKWIAGLLLLFWGVMQFVPPLLSLNAGLAWKASLNLEFVLGMLLYSFQDWWRPRLRHLGWVALSFGLLALLLVTGLEVPFNGPALRLDSAQVYYRDTIFLRHFPAVLPRGVFWGLPSALLVAAVVAQEERLARLAPSNWLRRLGDASFTLYLLHPTVLLPFQLRTGSWPLGWLAVMGGVAIAVSLRLYWVEALMARLTRRVLS